MTHRVRQSIATVTRAEVAKLVAPGGVRAWLIIAGILGTLAGGLVVALAHVPELQEISPLSLSDAMTAGPGVVALVLALGAASYVPREITEGTIVTSKYLVPRENVLFTSRLLSWLVVTVALSVATASVGLLAGLASTSVRHTASVESVLLLVVSVVVGCVVVLLAHSGATLLKRGTLCVAVGMLLLFVLPLVFALAAPLVSGVFADVLSLLRQVTLGSLLYGAMQLPSAQGSTWGAWASASSGLLVWLITTVGLAFLAFRNPGYGDV